MGIPSKKTLKNRKELINELMKVCDGYNIFEIEFCMQRAQEEIKKRDHYFHLNDY